MNKQILDIIRKASDGKTLSKEEKNALKGFLSNHVTQWTNNIPLSSLGWSGTPIPPMNRGSLTVDEFKVVKAAWLKPGDCSPLVSAVRMYRAITGKGLKEAKEWVDANSFKFGKNHAGIFKASKSSPKK